jgi:hypothetical protein
LFKKHVTCKQRDEETDMAKLTCTFLQLLAVNMHKNTVILVATRILALLHGNEEIHHNVLSVFKSMDMSRCSNCLASFSTGLHRGFVKEKNLLHLSRNVSEMKTNLLKPS